MKKLFYKAALLAAVTLLPTLAHAQQSGNAFERGLLKDETLRIDYIFAGSDKVSEISLDEMSRIDGWAGRRVNLDAVPVQGSMQLTMTDLSTGEVLYRNSYANLFREWQTTEEATRTRKSFENVFLVPMPTVKVEMKVELFDFWNKVVASMTHIVDPSDILIRPIGKQPAEHRYLLKSGDPKDCIDVAFVSEGYTEEEKELFYKDSQAGVDALLSYEPFKSRKDSFNFIAIFLPSKESGVSIPHEGIWLDTAVSSHFDTFYSQRYLTTLQLCKVHDLLAGLPYEHLLILANTDNYGGGGIYNSYTLTNSRNPLFSPVLVHEFGHSFGALADEYYYDDQYVNYYYPTVEPWEQNITTMVDFGAKWLDMVGKDGVGVIEGGGYMSKGVWRPCEDCRMHTNKAKDFCPVCRRAIERIIDFNTLESKR